MNKPYLIQRGEIKFPLNDYKGCKLSAAVAFDYMGSAEFEFGALPKAFRRIRAKIEQYRESKVSLMQNGMPISLRVFHCLSDDDFIEYAAWIQAAYTGEHSVHTKESVGLCPKSCHQPAINFWWDIDTDAMWSFDKKFMQRLPEHLKASFAVMEN